MLRRTVCAALLALPVACAGKTQPRTSPAPAPAALLQALRARQNALRAAILDTRTTSWLGGDRLVAEVDMIADRTGRLRFSASVKLRSDVAVLATDGRTFALIDDQRVFKEGPACAENVASVIRIPLLPAEVAAVLLGDAPVDPAARPVSVGWDGAAGADVLAIENPAGGGATTRLWITLRPTAGGADVLAVEGEAFGKSGRWRVKYEDFDRAGAVPHPRIIRFAEPGKSFDDGVEIKVKHVQVNPPLRDDAFVLSPGDLPREHMPCCRGCETKIKP